MHNKTTAIQFWISEANFLTLLHDFLHRTLKIQVSTRNKQTMASKFRSSVLPKMVHIFSTKWNNEICFCLICSWFVVQWNWINWLCNHPAMVSFVFSLWKESIVERMVKTQLIPCHFDTKSLENFFDKYFTDGATFFEVNLSFEQF